MPDLPETVLKLLAAHPPFGADDVTVGIENEWQVCVVGAPHDVDLAQTILCSNYYRNLVKRSVSGDVPGQTLMLLDQWLHDNRGQIWENSWVRFPRKVLNRAAEACLENDLRCDKTRSDSPQRPDAHRFFVDKDGECFTRLPVSYLLKLALLQVTGTADTPQAVARIARKIQDCFLNDNTSPEICSFFPVGYAGKLRPGLPAAREMLRRHLLTQLLAAYANEAMQLKANGQTVMVYAAPHPPLRQKMLNRLISDSFYRDLFMSPCLAGWNDGTAKYHYMRLCHEVLSRSQINAVVKMREAGIIQNNLVVLPTLSNIALANNGIHISLGSRTLTRWMADPDIPFTTEDEKNLGDLVAKIAEYFLPLFVGTYSAAPYKLDFMDFHPEKILGFLPHELDLTHVRMLWRRWKKKGRFKVIGRALTPFGPDWLDRMINRIMRFKGDFVPDFRLLDYPVALLSTEQCPGLDGLPGNDSRLLEDLMDQGVFDHRMPVYRLWRLREFHKMGFCGVEARYYSQFSGTLEDVPRAVCLQTLITAMAYRLIAEGKVRHIDIPDTPNVESERRQIFFGAAIGLPTFYLRKDNACEFMNRLLERVERTRTSRRYPGFIRVLSREYCKALVRFLRAETSGTLDSLKAGSTLDDLERRLEPAAPSAAAVRLSANIRKELDNKPIHRCSGYEFNAAAERYYRETLRRSETEQALSVMKSDIGHLQAVAKAQPEVHAALAQILPGCSPMDAFAAMKTGVLDESLDGRSLERMIHLLLLIIQAEAPPGNENA